MKILHTSDWHLGKSLCNKKLLEEQALLFEKSFFPLIKDLSPDVIVVAGDIVDKPNPDYETLKLLKEILIKLAETQIPTIFILGNHDSKRLSLFKEFLEFKKLYFVDDLTYFFVPFSYQKGTQKVYFYLFPYLSVFELSSLLKGIFSEKDIERLFFLKEDLNIEQILRFMITQVQIYRPAVFVGHFAISEAIFSGEENDLKLIGKEEVLSKELFEVFDIVFLGHLHRLQHLLDKFFYSGSPMPYSFEEATYKKGMWLIEINEKGLTHYEPIFLEPPVKIKIIEGYFEDLIKHPRDESYVKIILKNDKPVFRPYERLKTVFPNLLELKYKDLNEKEDISSTSDLTYLKELKFDEILLFKKFYEFVFNKTLDEHTFSVFERHLKDYKNLREKKLYEF